MINCFLDSEFDYLLLINRNWPRKVSNCGNSISLQHYHWRCRTEIFSFLELFWVHFPYFTCSKSGLTCDTPRSLLEYAESEPSEDKSSEARSALETSIDDSSSEGIELEEPGRMNQTNNMEYFSNNIRWMHVVFLVKIKLLLAVHFITEASKFRNCSLIVKITSSSLLC